MTSGDFKLAMRRVPTGVAVVTTFLDDAVKGFTVNAFASVSADAPTVLICVNRAGRTHPMIAAAGAFCLNVLSLGQLPLVDKFASASHAVPFDGERYRIGSTGCPIFEDAVAYFECTVAAEFNVETHTLFIGRVVDCASSEDEPLGYYAGNCRSFGLSYGTVRERTQ